MCPVEKRLWSLKFSEQPFMSIAKDLERKFNVRIRVESDPLRKEIFSGSFTKDYSLDKILREVCPVFFFAFSS